MKSRENQVQATDSKDKDETVVEEEAVTEDVEDYVGASTSQNIAGYFMFNRIPIYGHLQILIKSYKDKSHDNIIRNGMWHAFYPP